jgi:hypothetical protein
MTVFDLSGGPKTVIDLPTPVSAVAVAPGGALIAAVEPAGPGAVWTRADASRLAEFKVGEGARAAGFSETGRYLQIAGETGLTVLETQKFRPVIDRAGRRSVGLASAGAGSLTAKSTGCAPVRHGR